jgi:outer membrane protein W
MKKIILAFAFMVLCAPFIGAEATKSSPAGITATATASPAVQPAAVTITAAPNMAAPGVIGGALTATAAALTSTAAALTSTATALTSTAAGKVTITADAAASTIPAVVDLSPAIINFETTAKDGIKLSWAPKQKDNVYYNVYRSQAADYLKINKDAFLTSVYTDSDVLTSTVYYYKVEATDTSKNAYMSKTQSAKSADLTMPQVPAGMKAFQDIQSVTLKWSQAGQGSFPVSGYNFYRGKTPEESAFLKFVPFSKAYYSDEEVEPGLRYYYKMDAIDIKGNESKMTDTVSAVPYPRPRTNLCLMPTAYRNNIFDNNGLNVDMGFTYYIGTIAGEHNIAELKKADTFSKIGVWLLSLDAKWTFFNEGAGWWPSLGAGLMYSMLLQDNIGGSTSTQNAANGGGVNLGTKDSVLGQQSLYLTAAKDVALDTTMYAGYTQGFRFYKGDKAKGAAGYLTYIVSSIIGESNPNDSRASDTSAPVWNSYYFGLSRDIFKKIGVKLELTVPPGLNKNAFLPNTYIINTHIDRLFNFDIAYIHYDGGYAWMGYYNLRFSIYPSPYK